MLEGSILKQLVDGRTEPDTTPLNYGVYYKNTLVALCHALEDCILTSGSAPLVVTAFQRGKWYLEEADRYSAIADVAQQIVIMASPEAGFHDHPTSQRENVALVDLADNDPVAEEWHLIIFSPDYTAMVLCQELSESDYGKTGIPEHDLERKFYGFWTFDSALVSETVELAIAHVGRYNPTLQAQLADHLATLKQQNPALRSDEPAVVSHTVAQVVHYLQNSRNDLQGNLAFSVVDDLDQNLLSNELQAFLRMAQLVDLSDPVNPMAASEVVALLEMMGQLLDLPAWQLQRLRLAGMLHRIAPAPDLAALADDGPSCPLIPEVQALRLMPRMRAVAAIIAHQGECWDGSGYPAGLVGDAVPLESRMLALVAEFQRRAAQARHGQDPAETDMSLLSDVLTTCQAEAGQRWDPKLVEILGLMVMGLQQGMSLPTIPTKITLGSGLLNPDVADQASVFPASSELLPR
ncbi:DICT sensory domain-containing protein [Phormidium tenue]|uniref:Metal-dependent phosphohydrolase n=1 Tax=Phormidium tenue NIES-30 TaxID=549789 RepID=A0A1U7J5F0_9CYAN|nr:DICT sensory domain-containing protein [Phormidium tenue]MBD2232711.1 metal-dependent phosphohydrolase [Phormidium tenue FACHB-1052]OKH47828.1 metal-dependent phosphohydrolase [Phormidium tenue NIES-30]